MALSHFVPSPAALMWMEMRRTLGMGCPVEAGHDDEMAGDDE